MDEQYLCSFCYCVVTDQSFQIINALRCVGIRVHILLNVMRVPSVQFMTTDRLTTSVRPRSHCLPCANMPHPSVPQTIVGHQTPQATRFKTSSHCDTVLVRMIPPSL